MGRVPYRDSPCPSADFPLLLADGLPPPQADPKERSFNLAIESKSFPLRNRVQFWNLHGIFHTLVVSRRDTFCLAECAKTSYQSMGYPLSTVALTADNAGRPERSTAVESSR